MGDPTPAVNGETSPYHFFDHLTSYPVVNDSINTFKNNPYGQKSIHLADQGYNHFAKPVVPYFSRPLGYITPYLERVDSIGDHGLSHFDQRFPVVMEDTQTLKNKVVGYATSPFRAADEGKQYLLDKYWDEYKNCGGDGLFAYGKAAVTTSLLVTSESLAWFSSYLVSKKNQAEQAVHNGVKN